MAGDVPVIAVSVQRLSAAQVQAYEQYVSAHPAGMFYHGMKYGRLLEELLGCGQEYLLAYEAGALRGVLPMMYLNGPRGRVYNSLPYYGSNGGVLADDADARAALVRAYDELAGGKGVLSSTVIGNPFEGAAGRPGVRHTHSDHRISQLTALPRSGDPYEELMGRIRPSARRNVRKAFREGVTVERDCGQMDRLREMHQQNIRAIGGAPKSDRFFELVGRHFTPGAEYDLYTARRDGVVIAALLVFYYNGIVEYYTPAVDSAGRTFQPLSAIVITAMVDAARRHMRWWNWGGTWASQIGLYRFKKKWTTDERRYYYCTQLNDRAILGWAPERILQAYPNFFVVPFGPINRSRQHEQ